MNEPAKSTGARQALQRSSSSHLPTVRRSLSARAGPSSQEPSRRPPTLLSLFALASVNECRPFFLQPHTRIPGESAQRDSPNTGPLSAHMSPTYIPLIASSRRTSTTDGQVAISSMRSSPPSCLSSPPSSDLYNFFKPHERADTSIRPA